jgi:DNA repair ATPase RecN
LPSEVLVLTVLEIENFQSIHRLSLGLGKFTAVTGATGSGKSAVLRAVRLLAFNARGVSYITRGEKACAVQASAGGEHLAACAIERHQARGKDAYRLEQNVPVPSGGYGISGGKFTKLGGQVPPQVTEALQLSELNFAAQFDRPFLLDSSGGEIARVLGRLTNVTLLFDAAREANRRRREVMGDLKHAEANLASLTEAAQKFRGMKARQEAVSEAEEAMERVRHLSARRQDCQALTVRLEAAQEALNAAIPPEVPDGSRLDELAGKMLRIKALYKDLDAAERAIGAAKYDAGMAARTEEAAHKRLHEVLAEAGQCPTCNQPVAQA